MKRLAIGLVFILSAFCVAQNAVPPSAQHNVNVNMSTGRTGPAHKPDAPPSKDEAIYGQKLLELADSEAGALQGGMRAFANLRLAEAYQTSDKKKAIRLLEDSFSLTREIDNDIMVHTRSRLQVDILKTMAPLSLEKTEALLGNLEPRDRSQVLESMVSYYKENKKMDRAIQMVYRISAEIEFPYRTGVAIMEALPPDSPEFQPMFFTALASYKEHAGEYDGRVTTPSSDIFLMVDRFWKQLPAEQVKETIAEILKQAAPQNHKTTPVSLGSSAGIATFSDYYQYRLFEVLPVLKQIDKDDAERLLKKNQGAADQLAKFPDGFSTGMSAPLPQQKADAGDQKTDKSDQKPIKGDAFGKSVSITGPGSPEATAIMVKQAAELAKEKKILTEAVDHPDQALADAATLEFYRANALLNIAQIWRIHPTQAKVALKQAIEYAKEKDQDSLGFILPRAADLYMQMGDTAEAKRTVEKLLDAAAAVLKQDNDPDDPNKALRAHWPSTNAYAKAFRVAGKIDPAWALTILKEMPDSEVRFCAEIMLAKKWLNLPGGFTETVVAKKRSAKMMTEIEW